MKRKKSKIEVKEFLKLVLEIKSLNPYPLDIFVGKTQEGKIGQMCNKVWNDCCDDIIRIIKEKYESNNLL